MKCKLELFIGVIFFFFLKTTSGQSFINGDFEINDATNCEYNLSDYVFNSMVSNVFAFGKTNLGGNYVGETDILADGCYVTAQNGNWCIGIASDYVTYTTSDAVALELTSNLVPGNYYSLSFYLFGNTLSTSVLANVLVGESLADSTIGNVIDTVAPIANTWSLITLDFIATQASRYITVKNIPGTAGWNQIDNFTIESITGINSTFSTQEKIKIFPNPTSDFIVIQTGDSSKFLSATIRNAIGELIFTSNDSFIEFSQMKSGFYYVEVMTSTGKYVARIIRE